MAPFALLALLLLLGAVLIAIFGWNWARGPLQRTVQAQTGRALVIAGDLHVQLGWPALHVQARDLSFANPSWASAPQMLVLDRADFSISLPALLLRRLEFPEVNLARPVVRLETAPDGRKTWLLDSAQRQDDARVYIGQLRLDGGHLGYDDVRLKTHIQVELDTPDAATGDLVYSAKGSFKGQPLIAKGQGGSVLALRDLSQAYPIKVDATIGATGIRAEGRITGLTTLAGVDLQLALRGDSLAQLAVLLGVGLPATRSYVTAGHLVRIGKIWRYDKFSGRVGLSDVSGSLQVELGGARPMLRGAVESQVLDLADLGPPIGAHPLAEAPRNAGRILPELPFKPEGWRNFDADVTLHAASIRRASALPLEQLSVHLLMQDAVLTLAPLDFGVAGGHLKATIKLDGRQDQIQAKAQVQARKLRLGKLFPTLVLTKTSIGEVNGEFDLAGQGNSVGRMLGSANGALRMVVERGAISRLLMEQMGLHLLEILQLTLAGDKTIPLRCVVADFSLSKGVMTANTLLLDTDVSTLTGSGQINLAQETLDLTLVPHTRNTSVVALRSPIHVGGTLAAPVASLDTSRILARGGGALVLGLLNPLLALLPLVETGPGLDSECGRLLAQGLRTGPKLKAAPPAPAASRNGAQTPR